MGGKDKKEDRIPDYLAGLNPYAKAYKELLTWVQNRTNWPWNKVRFETRKYVAQGNELGYSVEDLLEFLRFRTEMNNLLLERAVKWSTEELEAISSDILLLYAAEVGKDGGKIPPYIRSPKFHLR